MIAPIDPIPNELPCVLAARSLEIHLGDGIGARMILRGNFDERDNFILARRTQQETLYHLSQLDKLRVQILLDLAQQGVDASSFVLYKVSFKTRLSACLKFMLGTPQQAAKAFSDLWMYVWMHPGIDNFTEAVNRKWKKGKNASRCHRKK